MKKDILKEQILLETISEIYIFLTIILFPLIVDSSGFFHIFECKWYTYVIMASVYLISVFVIILYYLLKKKINYFSKKKISIVQKLALLFLMINVLSFLFSPYLSEYNLLIGVGRGEGLLTMSLYVLTFIAVSLFCQFKKRYLIYFSVSSIIVSSICILQYIGFNPFNMYQNGIGTHNVSFMGTIGNIDFLSELYCLYVPISFASFIFLTESKKHKIIHFLSFILAFFIIGIINVSSGKVAFLATAILILPLMFLNNRNFSRFIQMIGAFLFAYCINLFINPIYHYSLQKLVFTLRFDYIVLSLLIISISCFILAYKLRKVNYEFKNRKRYLKITYSLLTLSVVIGILTIYMIDFNSGILYEMHELLHGNFDDNFGTYRIFLWKRTIKLIPEYPLLGSGPDTFAVRFMAKYTDDVAAIGPLTINDTAANVYLTMLINIGILGLLSYLIFIGSIICKSLKNCNKYNFVLLVTCICYLVQDFFNLSIVIVTPIFWLLLAITCNSMQFIDNNK